MFGGTMIQFLAERIVPGVTGLLYQPIISLLVAWLVLRAEVTSDTPTERFRQLVLLLGLGMPLVFLLLGWLSPFFMLLPAGVGAWFAASVLIGHYLGLESDRANGLALGVVVGTLVMWLLFGWLLYGLGQLLAALGEAPAE